VIFHVLTIFPEFFRGPFEHGVVAYPYTTEKPVEVLGAKYRWARAAGLLTT